MSARPALGPVMRYLLDLTGHLRPKFCLLATAGGDDAVWIRNFYDACSGQNIEPSHLQLFPMPNHPDIEDYLLGQHALWVGGGSVVNLLAVWEAHGLHRILRRAWEAGIVLGGISAGAICWSAGGTTDSYGPQLRPVINKNNLLPFSMGVHYDSEAQRRPLFQELIGKGALPEGYATDDGVALHFVDETLSQAISQEAGKRAYHVYLSKAGQVMEDGIEPELVTAI
ncbi:MAG TPA: peptidase E [Ktedonobacteraceae bacterium]